MHVFHHKLSIYYYHHHMMPGLTASSARYQKALEAGCIPVIVSDRMTLPFLGVVPLTLTHLPINIYPFILSIHGMQLPIYMITHQLSIYLSMALSIYTTLKYASNYHSIYLSI